MSTPMLADIEVEINLKMFEAVVSFEMSEGEITDITTLFVIINDLHQNFYFLLDDEEIRIGIIIDIETKLMERVKDED